MVSYRKSYLLESTILIFTYESQFLQNAIITISVILHTFIDDIFSLNNVMYFYMTTFI